MPSMSDIVRSNAGRIEPVSEYNTHAKTQVPKCIGSVMSLGPPDPTTLGVEFMYALSLP
jgi:hypothetical protein